jgi:hypothetical protein
MLKQHVWSLFYFAGASAPRGRQEVILMPENNGFKPGNSKHRGRPPKVDKLDEYIKHHTDNEQAKYSDAKLAELATLAFGVHVGETTIWDHRRELGIDAANDHGGDRSPKIETLPGLSSRLDYRYQSRGELREWLKQEGQRACAMKRTGLTVPDSWMVMIAWDYYDHTADGRHTLSKKHADMALYGYPKSWNSVLASCLPESGGGKIGHQGGRSDRSAVAAMQK